MGSLRLETVSELALAIYFYCVAAIDVNSTSLCGDLDELSLGIEESLGTKNVYRSPKALYVLYLSFSASFGSRRVMLTWGI